MLSKQLHLLIILDGIVSQISSGESTSDNLHADAELLAEQLHQRVLLFLLDLFELLVGVSDTRVTVSAPQVVASDEFAESVDRILL